MPDWYRSTPSGALHLSVHAQPGARRTEVAGLHGGALKVRVAAPALEDRANEALAAYLAARLGLPRRNVVLLSGARSREKRFEIVGCAPERLAALAG